MAGGRQRRSRIPQFELSAFTRKLINDLMRDHYRPRAWRALLSRSWVRSLEDINSCPDRSRSFLVWTISIALTGFAVVLLTPRLQSPGQPLAPVIMWLTWFAGTAGFVLLHLGMADDDQGAPHGSLLLANGLSFLRFALAPLVLWPCLSTPVNPASGPLFALFLLVLSLTDVVDGWSARRQNHGTRLGRMLDFLADLTFVTFLAIGLYLAGAIPGSLLWLVILRYPLTLMAGMRAYFSNGSARLRPTIMGKIATFATNVVLLMFAFGLLLPFFWPSVSWFKWLVQFLYWLLSANILYLLYRGFAPAWHGRSSDPRTS